MSTAVMMDEVGNAQVINPGVQLAKIRQQKGYTVEYIADALCLKLHIIDIIDRGDLHLLPQPVFAKGYLRAYAKLLGVAPEPLLLAYNEQYAEEKKADKALLWQSKRESSYKAEFFIRWFTIIFALGVMVAVGVWWHGNKEEGEANYSSATQAKEADVSLNEEEHEVKLTDLSKMQALLNPSASPNGMSILEKPSE